MKRLPIFVKFYAASGLRTATANQWLRRFYLRRKKLAREPCLNLKNKSLRGVSAEAFFAMQLNQFISMAPAYSPHAPAA